MIKSFQIKDKTSSPSAREGHAAFYYNEIMYIFGGYDGKWLNDMYKFDTRLHEWSKSVQENNTPTERSGHSMTYITSINKFLLFGGFNGEKNNYFNDVHLYDPDTNKWEEIKCAGEKPHCREAHGALYSESKKSLYIQSGYGRKQLGDLAVLCIDNWTWSQQFLSFEGGLNDKSLLRSKYAFAPKSDFELLIMGGDAGKGSTGAGLDSSKNDLILLSMKTNSASLLTLNGAIPSVRNGHTLTCIDNNGEKFLLYGGTNGGTEYYSQIYELDMKKGMWKEIKVSVEESDCIKARENHSCVYNPLKNQMILFGGCLGIDYSNDLFFLELKQPSKTCTLQ